LRFLLWRLLGLLAVLVGLAVIAWFLHGGLGMVLRGSTGAGTPSLDPLADALNREAHAAWSWDPIAGLAPARLSVAFALALGAGTAAWRWWARRRRRYLRLRIDAYRTDHAAAEALVTMLDTVQFLDSPGGSGARDQPGDGSDGTEDDKGELVAAGAGAEQDGLVF